MAKPAKKGSSSQKVSRNSAAPGGKSTAELVRKSNLWRDNYNPIRGLVISRVVQLLEAADRGDYVELQLVVRKIEKRYPVLKALKARRLAAIEKLDWEIKTIPAEKLPAGVTETDATAQQEFLRSRYEAVENLTDAFGQLVLAEFRGYAILQKHRYTEGEHDGAVRELHWLPQWCFSRDGQFGDFFWNENSQFGVGVGGCVGTLGEKNRVGGDDLPREDFVMREHDGALYEIALIAFVNWAMGRKDWAAFVEIFGLPNAIVVMPPNIPQGKEAEYQAAAEKVADGVSGAIPYGGDAKFPSASVRGNAPFKEFCDAQDSDVVLAGTGGLLTMLSLPQGIGSGSSEQHGDAFDDIAEADARRINETLQRDFDRVELAAEFPGQPVLAYFELSAREEEDVTATIKQIKLLKDAGYPVTVEMVEEKTGFEIEEANPEEPTDPASFPAIKKLQNRSRKILNTSGGNPYHDDHGQFTDESSAVMSVHDGFSESADYAPVNAKTAEAWKRVKGLDVSGFKHQINGRDVLHTYKHHSQGREASDVQRGVRKADFQRIPEVVHTADEHIDGGVSQQGGQPTMRYIKHYPNGSHVVVEERLAGMKRLSYKTMWIKKSGSSAATAGKTVNRSAPSLYVRNDGRTDGNNLPSRPSEVKFFAAVAADLQPLRDRLAAILQISDPAILETKLRAFRGDIEQLKADILADPASARELEAILAQGLVAGMTNKTATP